MGSDLLFIVLQLIVHIKWNRHSYIRLEKEIQTLLLSYLAQLATHANKQVSVSVKHYRNGQKPLFPSELEKFQTNGAGTATWHPF